MALSALVAQMARNTNRSTAARPDLKVLLLSVTSPITALCIRKRAGRLDRDLDQVLMHVDSGDALVQHLHARGHLLQRHPQRWDKARRPPEPGSIQETDTRARSGNGGYPARGSSAGLTNGLERSTHKRRRRAARQHNCAPSAPLYAARSPQKPRPPANSHHAHSGRDPVFVTHGSATQRRMISNNGYGRLRIHLGSDHRSDPTEQPNPTIMADTGRTGSCYGSEGPRMADRGQPRYAFRTSCS